MAIKVCLDAGHYGQYNRSKVVKGYYESEMNWKLHNFLAEELERYGVEVIKTRADQKKDLGLVARGKKSKGCNLFLSIHSNACDAEYVDYPLVITMQDGKGDTLGLALAKKVQELMGTKQAGKITKKRGTFGGEWYSVLEGADAVGVMGMIIEHSFHTNKKAATWLLSEANLRKMAEEEAKIIADHFGLGKTSSTKPAASESTSAPAPAPALPTLSNGAEGATVKALQILLTGYGYSCGAAGVDGDFGGGTEAAVKQFQKAKKLDVDGVVGKNTWTALLGL